MERKGIGMKGKMLKEVQFVDDEHEKFFLDNIVRCRYEEVYHHALIYCLGISETTRRNIDSLQQDALKQNVFVKTGRRAGVLEL